MVLTFSEQDPSRPEKEALLRALSEAHDMEALYPLARGMKTIQRIAGERGLVIKARRLAKASDA